LVAELPDQVFRYSEGLEVVRVRDGEIRQVAQGASRIQDTHGFTPWGADGVLELRYMVERLRLSALSLPSGAPLLPETFVPRGECPDIRYGQASPTPSGLLVAWSCGFREGAVLVALDPETGIERVRIHFPDLLLQIIPSPDGRLLLAWGNSGPRETDRLLLLETGTLATVDSLKAPADWYLGMGGHVQMPRGESTGVATVVRARSYRRTPGSEDRSPHPPEVYGLVVIWEPHVSVHVVTDPVIVSREGRLLRARERFFEGPSRRITIEQWRP